MRVREALRASCALRREDLCPGGAGPELCQEPSAQRLRASHDEEQLAGSLALLRAAAATPDLGWVGWSARDRCWAAKASPMRKTEGFRMLGGQSLGDSRPQALWVTCGSVGTCDHTDSLWRRVRGPPCACCVSAEAVWDLGGGLLQRLMDSTAVRATARDCVTRWTTHAILKCPKGHCQGLYRPATTHHGKNGWTCRQTYV
ncbi:hypothetical protein TREES_T100014545 [Tupaia chinensis]|uniref:Uncharacterized protein n=1 Tax=Tupaia chinensis TaxID=246437 RepID=L9LBJ9_TUPCH|nr:hypothetical protein TREES_T100014545 [Tupaia chinensis]